jgi:S1-C subfamily serine protease
MALRKHHKIMIGSASSLVFVFMIVSGIIIYGMYVKQDLQYNQLSTSIVETQNQITELTTTLLETKQDINELNTEVDSQFNKLDEEFTLLKASAGEDFSGIIEDSIKSVVTIRTNAGQGTGFLINSEGYIVTNAHVLATPTGSLAGNIQALTYEQKTIPAEYIGYNPGLDVALLKIQGDYTYLKLDNSDNIQIGEKVIAIGNPLGLQFSVSQGIVSATHRPGANSIEAYVQTDAALNPGNSGGPLINTEGYVIGINNFKMNGGESLGFALESNTLKETINNIAQNTLNQSLV